MDASSTHEHASAIMNQAAVKDDFIALKAEQQQPIINQTAV